MRKKIDQRQRGAGPVVQSVGRALDILETLRDAGGPLRAAQIALRVRLHVNTTHNLLRTLLGRGYLRRVEEGTYALGAPCWRLGEAADRWEPLRQAALEPMEAVSRETGLDTYLGVNGDGQLLFVAHFRGQGAIRIAVQTWTDQFHATAAGKVLLAFADDETRQRIVRATGPWKQLTPRTITGAATLDKHLEQVRRQGYALCVEEGAKDVASIGVPVCAGTCVAAIAQPFPSFYLESGRIEPACHAALLTRAAATIAAELSVDTRKEKRGGRIQPSLTSTSASTSAQ